MKSKIINCKNKEDKIFDENKHVSILTLPFDLASCSLRLLEQCAQQPSDHLSRTFQPCSQGQQREGKSGFQALRFNFMLRSVLIVYPKDFLCSLVSSFDHRVIKNFPGSLCTKFSLKRLCNFPMVSFGCSLYCHFSFINKWIHLK